MPANSRWDLIRDLKGCNFTSVYPPLFLRFPYIACLVQFAVATVCWPAVSLRRIKAIGSF